jgi:hypothetical protein
MPKVFNGVCELPLLRNAQKRHTKKSQKIKKKSKTKGTYLPHFVAICQMCVAFTFCLLVSSQPLGPSPPRVASLRPGAPFPGAPSAVCSAGAARGT